MRKLAELSENTDPLTLLSGRGISERPAKLCAFPSRAKASRAVPNAVEARVERFHSGIGSGLPNGKAAEASREATGAALSFAVREVSIKSDDAEHKRLDGGMGLVRRIQF